MDAKPNIRDNYGQQLVTYYVPQKTGNHYFYIAVDDDGQLWVSPDSNPRNKKIAIKFGTAVGHNQFFRYLFYYIIYSQEI